MAAGGVPKKIYKRSFIQLSLAIILIFGVLGLTFLVLFNRLSLEQVEKQMTQSAEAMASEFEKSLDPTYGELISSEPLRYVGFTARSTNSIIWVVNSRGLVIYGTAFPNTGTEAFEEVEGYYQLPAELQNREEEAVSHGTAFAAYLDPEERWLSVSCPLTSDLGGYYGEVIFHKALNPDDLPGAYLSRTLLFSLIIAIVVAFFAIILLSRNLTRPISELAKTAEKVYRGDLSARVKLGRKNEAPLLQGYAPGEDKRDDDLTLLVKTMNTLIANLEEEEDERQAFLASISHDLRTPITSIKGFVEGILDGTIPPEAHEKYLDLVSHEIRRIEGLVESLFQVSLMEKKDRLDRTVFDLNHLILETIAALEGQIKSKNIHLSYELFREKDDGSLPVTGDPDLLQRVVANLLTNAVRFTPEGGDILIASKQTDDPNLAVLTVEDSGPGIPDEQLPRIYDRFYKGDKARASEGSGLGLFIVRSILQRHGHEIHYFGSSLGGAGFAFHLDRPAGRKI